MKGKLFALLLVLVVSVGACEEDNDDDHACDITHNAYAPTVVSFTYNSNGYPVGYNLCDYYYLDGEYCDFVDYIWCCADYQGRHNVYVDLSWKNCGSGWQFDSEFVSSGICDEDCL